MQTLDIILQANEVKAFDIGGAYFEFIEGNGPIDVNFVSASGSRSKDLEMLGALPGYWVSGAFSRFELKNTFAFSQTVRIMFGSGVGGSRRVQGAVSVIDGGRASTLANQAFVGYVGIVAAAACVPQMQLLNPAGSGKIVTVKQMRGSCSAAGLLRYLNWGTALPEGPYNPSNKRLSGATSTARTYRNTAAGVASGVSMETISISANQVFQLALQEPIVLEPGNGLIISHDALASTLTAAFEFVETTL